MLLLGAVVLVVLVMSVVVYVYDHGRGIRFLRLSTTLAARVLEGIREVQTVVTRQLITQCTD